MKPAGPVILAGLFLHLWVQHALWGRTRGKRLLGVRVTAVRTGGRLGAARAALRMIAGRAPRWCVTG
ncbi:RDD family protein [Streptosporangium amethystogenes]|uniref:RDD family protein n=1 Tax=Streptosporangium amethystogenes TaxID=2002 RepID=UPI00316ABF8D